jgi:hypothetical protein
LLLYPSPILNLYLANTTEDAVVLQVLSALNEFIKKLASNCFGYKSTVFNTYAVLEIKYDPNDCRCNSPAYDNADTPPVRPKYYYVVTVGRQVGIFEDAYVFPHSHGTLTYFENRAAATASVSGVSHTNGCPRFKTREAAEDMYQRELKAGHVRQVIDGFSTAVTE